MKPTNSKMNGNRNGHRNPKRTSPRTRRPLHKIREVRQRQGVSLRTVARLMHAETTDVKKQEESPDLKLSVLYRWQDALKVPVTELLAEPNDGLSVPVLQRTRLLRIMKTAVSILNAPQADQMRNLARQLVEELVELSPDLKEITAWRPNSELPNTRYGKLADNTVPDDFFLRPH